MKNRISNVRLSTATGAVLLVAFSIGFAGDTSTAQEPAAPKAAVTTGAPAASVATAEAAAGAEAKLPYGVADVLKLSRAQVGDEITLTYIRNSGTIYNLGPKDIVYLRDQGVSDRVISTMLDQRKKLTEVAAQTAPPPATQPPASPDTGAAAPAYVEPAPAYVAPSSVYVIPYPTSSYYGYYNGYYGGYYQPYCGPYYGGFYGYPGVGLSFRFGFGGGHGHHFHGRR